MRTTNLLHTYINSANHPTIQQYQSDKVSRDFDVHRELTNRTFIKPLPSKGKLVNTTIMDYPAEIQKDIKYDAKALFHAIKGEANDHELGRLNDVAMKFGGLILAAYLFTKKQTPKTKLFEFIGFGTFFAAMDLWPKLFIQLPAKLIHGFNVRQQYEDSFGRKKMFYQDHQFIPWDLYSDDEINRIGDKLGIPKTIPNRRNAIQEKMRQIALQNNTLWMLTAGFATPLMSALICNGVDGVVGKFADRRMDKYANKLTENFNEEIKKFDFSKSQERLERLLAENEGKPITKELYDAVFDSMSNGHTRPVIEALRKDLDLVLPTDKSYKISDASAVKIQNAVKEIFKTSKLPDEVIERIVPKAETITDRFNSRGLLNNVTEEFSEYSKIIQDIIAENIRNAAPDLDERSKKILDFYSRKVIHSPQLNQDSPLIKALKFESGNLLTPEIISKLSYSAKQLDSYKAGRTILSKIAYIKVAQAPETGLANIWNQASDKMFKALNFTKDEISSARLDNEIAGEILRNKLEALVSNKDGYEKFIKKMENILSGLYSRTAQFYSAQDNNDFKTLINTTCDNAAGNLMGKGMGYTARAIGGIADINGNFVASQTSDKHLLHIYVNDRIKGVKSSFYRFLNLADLYYRIANIKGDHPILNGGLERGIKEEMVELAKTITLDGHTADFMIKFWQRRDPDMVNPGAASDKSQVEVKNGKVINKYLGVGEKEYVEFANDRHYFANVMRLMYGEDLHPDTIKHLGNTGFLEDFRKYRQSVLNILGDYKYFAKPNHMLNVNEYISSSEDKFLVTGCAPSEMASKAFNNMFNSGKWLSTFGKMGIGLVSVTLLAQLLIGRNNNPWKNKEVK